MTTKTAITAASRRSQIPCADKTDQEKYLWAEQEALTELARLKANECRKKDCVSPRRRLRSAEAARLLGISVRQLQRIAQAGWISKPYELRDVVRGYVSSRANGRRRRSVNERYHQMRVTIQQLKFDILRHQHLPRDLVFPMLDELEDFMGQQRLMWSMTFSPGSDEQERLNAVLDSIDSGLRRELATMMQILLHHRTWKVRIGAR